MMDNRIACSIGKGVISSAHICGGGRATMGVRA